ncbi:MAG: Fe-S cluster assembly protein SufD [bacterium]|nr:Fe-S cluster assembly protein SufD [bacterium]
MAKLDSEYTIPDLAPELQRGPTWLQSRRQTLREKFNDLPLPPRGLHLWRYTDPSKFMQAQTAEASATGSRFADLIEQERKHLSESHLAGLVTDFAGRDIKALGVEKLAAKGVVITALSDAVESHLDLVEKHLYGLIGSEMGKFEAMNGALWNDGIFVYVPDNTTVEQPLHLLRESGGAGSAQFPRLLVVVGRNAELTIIDEYGGGSADKKADPAYSNGAVEIYGLEDSRTRYVSLQRNEAATNSYLTHRAKIASGASMLTVPLAFGGALSKQNFGVILNGPGAESNMYGMLFGSGRQHFDNHTLHHHAAGKTHSNIDIKVVLRDKAISAYTGLIRIDETAQTCEAYQENRNLLLSSGTKAETIPELEILNEDVSCSHGATVGPIDPIQLFYLMCRGIQLEAAQRMIVSGFVVPTLNRVPQDMRERITRFVDTRLENV